MCKDICPKNAISYTVDDEGFWYPEIDKQGHTTIISHVVSDNFENTIRYCAHSGQANDKSISETFWAGSPNGKIYIVHMRDKIITG